MGRGGGGGGAEQRADDGEEARRALPVMPVKVLLAEADDSTRHVISALLRKCGYHGAHLNLPCLLQISDVLPISLVFRVESGERLVARPWGGWVIADSLVVGWSLFCWFLKMERILSSCAVKTRFQLWTYGSSR
jgi:hypothetical protein